MTAALAAGIAYGSNAPFATLASRVGVPAGDAVFWRAFLMLLLAGSFAFIGRGRSLPERRAIPPLLALGVATSITSIGYLSSVAFIPVSVAAIIFYTYPLFILLLTPLIERSAPDLSRLAVFAVAFSGIVLVVGPSLGALDGRGLALALLASAGATGMFYLSAQAMKRLDPMPAAFWVHLIVLPAAFVVALVSGGPVELPHTASFTGIFIVICGSYLLGYVLQLFALRHLSPAAAGLLFLAEPAVAILTAALVLDERLTATQGLGCGIVFSSLVAATYLESRPAKGNAP